MKLELEPGYYLLSCNGTSNLSHLSLTDNSDDAQEFESVEQALKTLDEVRVHRPFPDASIEDSFI